MGVLRLLVVLIAFASQAEAGAWARGEGRTFATLAYTASGDPQTLGTLGFDPEGYLSLLIEHGLSDRLTFGIDAGRSDSGDGKAMLYLSRTFGPERAANRFAFHAGLGTAQHDDTSEGMSYLGASWGRGFDTRWGPGWAALDTSIYYRFQSEAVVAKADFTMGIKPSDRTTVFVQLQSGQYPDSDAYVRIVPSTAFQFAPGKHVELGTPIGLTGDPNVGFKAGLWLEF